MILSVGGLAFVSDEVPEQAEVSSFFFRGLKVLCLQVLAHRWLPATKNRDERNYHAD
jgi:oligoribonuclease (3'-5' exoribonuclease)